MNKNHRFLYEIVAETLKYLPPTVPEFSKVTNFSFIKTIEKTPRYLRAQK
jgi:hypothetical protein